MKYHALNPKRSQSSKSFSILLFVLFLVAIAAGYLAVEYAPGFLNKAKSNLGLSKKENVISDQPIIPERATIDEYYLVVVHPKSRVTNFSFSDLKSIWQGENTDWQPVLVDELKSEVLSVLELSEDGVVQDEVSKDQIVSRILENEKAISILPFSLVDFRLRSIRVDSQTPLDKNFQNESYRLKISRELNEGEESFGFSKDRLISIHATGEIILARGVAERIIHYNNVLYPFEKMGPILKEADFTVSTLEAPLVDGCEMLRETMVFCGDLTYGEGLTFSGIDLVSLAANHIRDFGEDGIAQTINYLDESGIKHVGAGENLEAAHKPEIIELDGIKFGFLAYNDVVPTAYEATTDSAGSAWANLEEVKVDIESLRPQVDYLIVMPHWGIEYTNVPSQRQIEIAHTAIDAGADFILGDHPHWVQGVEYYKDRYIIYGVGNFVFDQMWSQETREGVYLSLTFYGPKLMQIEYHPMVIEDYAQPRLADQAESEAILNRIWEASVWN